MGDEFGEVTEDVKEDFTPAEGLEEAEVEEIPEDTEEEISEEVSELEEDFTPAEELEEAEVEEIPEDTEEEISEEVSELEEDFTPAEGLEEAEVEEIPEDMEEASEETSEMKEDFTPAERLGEAEVEEIPEDTEEEASEETSEMEKDFTPAEELEEAGVEEIPEDTEEEISEEVSELEEDFTPAEGLEEAEVEEIPEDTEEASEETSEMEEDFTPAEGLEEAEVEEIPEDTEEEASEETSEMEEDFTSAEGLEETEVEEMPEDTEEEAFEMNETGEDGGIPVKVLKPNGDTSTHVPEYEEEIAALDKGIENAKQPYLDEAKEIADEYNRIVEDSEMENEDKISSLEMEKARLTSLKDQWKEESSEWYEEKDRLQKMKSQQTIDDMQENESVDISSDELNSFSDKIKNFWEDDTEDNAYVSDNTNKIHDINNQAKDIRSPKSIEGMDANEPNVDVFPLEKTNQTINNIELDDGSEQKIFDHPDRLLNELPYSQGINEFDKEGTCALANLGSWLEIGGSRNVENDIVKYASTHMDMYGNALCSENGGVLPENIPVIWKQFGVDAYLDGSKNLEHIAEAVESGKAVSVGVNAGKLYESDNIENIDLNDCYGDGGANHAIGVMSCARDAITGNLTHFYINDTGRDLARDACRKVKVVDFLQAFNVKRGVAIISKKPIW